MARRSRWVADVGGEMSADVRSAYEDARGEMDAWIDEKMDTLKAEADATHQQELGEMQRAADEAEQCFKDATHDLNRLVGDLNQLSRGFQMGDGVPLDDAIAETRALVGKVQTEIKQYEDRWRGIGQKVTQLGLKAAKSVIGIP